MAWIEAHQAVNRHGKTVLLAQALSIPRAQAVGHLMGLWWWAMDSCGRGGSLARYSPAAIADGAGWDSHASGEHTEEPRGDVLDFYAALVESGWIDHEGDLPSDRSKPVGGGARIHDWEQYSARFFDMEIRREMEREATRARVARFRAGNGDVTEAGNGVVTPCNAPTNQTNQTNQPTKRTTASSVAFDLFWSAYPNKVGKSVALKAWTKLAPDHDLAAKIMVAVAVQKQGAQWSKDGGQFIPHPSTWLNGRRWEDEVKPASSVGGRVVGAAAPVAGKYDHLDR